MMIVDETMDNKNNNERKFQKKKKRETQKLMTTLTSKTTLYSWLKNTTYYSEVRIKRKTDTCRRRSRLWHHSYWRAPW